MAPRGVRKESEGTSLSCARCVGRRFPLKSFDTKGLRMLTTKAVSTKLPEAFYLALYLQRCAFLSDCVPTKRGGASLRRPHGFKYFQVCTAGATVHQKTGGRLGLFAEDRARLAVSRPKEITERPTALLPLRRARAIPAHRSNGVDRTSPCPGFDHQNVWRKRNERFP